MKGRFILLIVVLVISLAAILTALAQEESDEIEPNDSKDNATSFGGARIDGEVGLDGDNDDWFVLEGQEGINPTLTLTHGVNCDIDVEVFSGSDFMGRMNGMVSPDSREFDVQGTCYLHVYANWGGGTYTISITPAWATVLNTGGGHWAPDDHSNSFIGATSIVPCEIAIQGEIDYVDDVDYFGFQAISGKQYMISSEGPMDSFLYLYSTDGISLLDYFEQRKGAHGSLIFWECSSTGIYYFKITGGMFDRIGSYELYVREVEPDDFPNSFAEAAEVTVDGPFIHGQFGYAHDEDYFMFQAVSGQRYEIEIVSQRDTVLDLYAFNGNEHLAHNDDYHSRSSSRIAWNCTVSGTYHVVASVYDFSDEQVGSYTLVFRTVEGDWLTDDHPDTHELATELSVGSDGMSGRIEFWDDVDFFNFHAYSEHIYSIETEGPLDSIITLFATDGTTMLSQNDDQLWSLQSRIDWRCRQTGSYYVRVQGFETDTAVYSIHIDEMQERANDDHSDFYGNGSDVDVDGPRVTGNIDYGEDVDYFKFNAITGEIYIIETSGFLDTVLSLYDSDGITEIAYNDDYLSTFLSYIEWTCSAGGVYFVKVSTYYPDATGIYELSINSSHYSDQAFADDHSDIWEEASFLTTGETGIQGEINGTLDVDFFKFQASPGNTYIIETGGQVPINICLYATDGINVIHCDSVFDFRGVEQIWWTCESAGTYFISVESDYNFYSTVYRDLGVYTLYIIESSPDSPSTWDDHSNTYFNSTLISPDGSPVRGEIEAMGDKDCFQFEAEESLTYTVESTGNQRPLVFLFWMKNGIRQNYLKSDGTTAIYDIPWTCPESGIYYIEAKAGGWTVGNYELTLNTID